MAEISRGQVTYNTVAGSVGAAAALVPGLFNGLMGNRGCDSSENQPVNRYEMALMQENAALKTQVEMHKAEIYTDNKLEARDEKYENRFRNIENRLCEQAIFNEKTSAAVGCVAQQTATMQALINSLTAVVIPKQRICPEPMDRYNSWSAPTQATTTPTT